VVLDGCACLLPHRAIHLRALDLYATYPIDFGDAILLAQMERQRTNEIYSYDRDFDRVPEVVRLEP